MDKLTVRDVMHVGVITCRPETPVAEVAERMKAHGVSALVVTDEAGYAIGVISRTDLINTVFIQPYLERWRGMTARHLMSVPAISVRAERPLEEAIELIREKKIHRLVVTERASDRERPIGILSVTDLALHAGEEL
jgi:CBS domain-containing protein